MNKVLALVLKFGGFNKVWGLLDGKKTYAAAALGILTSLAGLGVEIAPILSAHDTAALLALVQALPSNPSWLSLVASFGLLGLGHGAKKVEAAAASPTV
jgi:hypothetical protein